VSTRASPETHRPSRRNRDDRPRRYKANLGVPIRPQTSRDPRRGHPGVPRRGLRRGEHGRNRDGRRVSKPTVYNHFADKQQLFEQIVNDLVAVITQRFYGQIVNLSDDGDLAKRLRELARLLLKGVMQPTSLRLRRLVIGEAGRSPDLGRAYERQGPGRARAAWATAFKRLADEGRLRLRDPALAAEHFQSLVLTTPLNHAMFSGDDRPPGAAQIKRYADRAVDVFLAAYGSA